MKLQKAIDHLDNLYHNWQNPPDPDTFDSIKLGMEALRRCDEFRKYTPHTIYILLPGETDD